MTAATPSLIEWGTAAFQVVLLGICGWALVEAVQLWRDPLRRSVLTGAMREAMPWALGLAVAQLAVIGLALFDPQFKLLGLFAGQYLFFAGMLPVLWGVGKCWGDTRQMPLMGSSWSEERKRRITIVMALAGFFLNLFLLLLTDVRAGESVAEMTGGLTPVALAALAMWLIFNAPWMEEVLLRHFLLARVARDVNGDGRNGQKRIWLAIVAVAALFSVGHLGHMEPLWPKIVQTFAWGLMLGWARVWLGTRYAIALHLAWNVSAPLVAPLVGGG